MTEGATGVRSPMDDAPVDRRQTFLHLGLALVLLAGQPAFFGDQAFTTGWVLRGVLLALLTALTLLALPLLPLPLLTLALLALALLTLRTFSLGTLFHPLLEGLQAAHEVPRVLELATQAPRVGLA